MIARTSGHRGCEQVAIIRRDRVGARRVDAGPPAVGTWPAAIPPLSWASVTDIREIPVRTLSDQPTTLGELAGGKALLVVNVASKCGLTPQYTGLVELQQTYGPRGFSVVGVPCNQFMGQEPGTAEEIEQFCSTTYGVDFPLLAKVDVNGDDRHPLYQELVRTADAEGAAGDIQWNFEKFLVGSDGAVVGRFRPRTEPKDPAVVSAIEDVLG
ncbi:MAG: glutathione peroxidase [Nocardia sp.]|nr:glutathione peroxidase [Nocardia sp.]